MGRRRMDQKPKGNPNEANLLTKVGEAGQGPHNDLRCWLQLFQVIIIDFFKTALRELQGRQQSGNAVFLLLIQIYKCGYILLSLPGQILQPEVLAESALRKIALHKATKHHRSMSVRFVEGW